MGGKCSWEYDGNSTPLKFVHALEYVGFILGCWSCESLVQGKQLPSMAGGRDRQIQILPEKEGPLELIYHRNMEPQNVLDWEGP